MSVVAGFLSEVRTSQECRVLCLAPRTHTHTSPTGADADQVANLPPFLPLVPLLFPPLLLHLPLIPPIPPPLPQLLPPLLFLKLMPVRWKRGRRE